MNVAFANAVQPRALAYAAGGEPEAPGGGEPVRALLATPLFHVTANNCVAQVVTLVGGSLTTCTSGTRARRWRLSSVNASRRSAPCR
jgi:hypothetical protein